MANIVNLKPNKKGEPRLGGRKVGTPNKNTRILKDALLDESPACARSDFQARLYPLAAVR